jgi:hypothetical protein
MSGLCARRIGGLNKDAPTRSASRTSATTSAYPRALIRPAGPPRPANLQEGRRNGHDVVVVTVDRFLERNDLLSRYCGNYDRGNCGNSREPIGHRATPKHLPLLRRLMPVVTTTPARDLRRSGCEIIHRVEGLRGRGSEPKPFGCIRSIPPQAKER